MSDDRCRYPWAEAQQYGEQRAIECPCCEGYGAHPIAVCVSKWADPADAYDEVPCTFCNGTGRALQHAEPITLDDLDEMCGDPAP